MIELFCSLQLKELIYFPNEPAKEERIFGIIRKRVCGQSPAVAGQCGSPKLHLIELSAGK